MKPLPLEGHFWLFWDMPMFVSESLYHRFRRAPATSLGMHWQWSQRAKEFIFGAMSNSVHGCFFEEELSEEILLVNETHSFEDKDLWGIGMAFIPRAWQLDSPWGSCYSPWGYKTRGEPIPGSFALNGFLFGIESDRFLFYTTPSSRSPSFLFAGISSPEVRPQIAYPWSTVFENESVFPRNAGEVS